MNKTVQNVAVAISMHKKKLRISNLASPFFIFEYDKEAIYDRLKKWMRKVV